MNEVQFLIDRLAMRLSRPVGVDDRRFRAVAYSSHSDEIDAVRRTSILGRQAPDAVIDWLEGLGLMQARGLVHVPANPAFEMVARVSVPVRFNDRLLGFLWLVESDQPLGADELELAQRTAEDLAQELYRERQQTNDERRAEALWIEQTVAGQVPVPTSRVPGIAADAVYVALVVRISSAARLLVPAGVDVRLAYAIDQVRRGIAPRHQLAATSPSEAIVILSAGTHAEVERHATVLLAAVESELADVDDIEVIVGVGDLADEVDGLPDSAAGARRAARLGRTMPELGRLIRWGDLGVVRLLGELTGDQDPAAFVPEPLRRLFADPDGPNLVATLEAYLEQGGDAAAAAAELFVHRSSLYNRLRRIEEVAGIDVRSGADRLEVHLGIRLWRMGGAPALTCAPADRARAGR